MPIVAFFITYKLHDIYVATAVLIGLMGMTLIIQYIWKRQVEKMHLISFLFILIMGGATIFFRNDTFLKWKPTVINGIFALVFLGSHFTAETVFERILKGKIPAPPEVLKKHNVAWIIYFIFLGVANYVVAFNMSTDAWVNFKLFGNLAITMVFAVFQAVSLGKYIKQQS